MNGSPRYLWRILPDGTRQISWRVWVLVWVTTACFTAGALTFSGIALYQQMAMTVTEGEVVRVYEWDSENPFDEGPKVYSPVWRYTWADGAQTEATAGVSSSLWNFPIGTKRQIRYWPDRKDDIVLVDPSEWLVTRVLAIIAAISLVPAGIATLMLRRWTGRTTAR